MRKVAPNKAMIRMRVCRHGLEPVSHIDADMLNEYQQGQEVEVTLYRPKSSDELRLFWAVLGEVLPSQSKFQTTRDMADALLMETGHVREVTVTMDGSVNFFPKSIREMGHEEFHEFFQLAKGIIGRIVIPGLDVDEMIEEMGRWGNARP